MVDMSWKLDAPHAILTCFAGTSVYRPNSYLQSSHHDLNDDHLIIPDTAPPMASSTTASPPTPEGYSCHSSLDATRRTRSPLILAMTPILIRIRRNLGSSQVVWLAILLLLKAVLPGTHAQAPPGPPSTAPLSTAIPSTTRIASFTATGSASFSTTLHKTTSRINSTISSSSRVAEDIPPQLFSPANANSQHDPDRERSESAFNYYFLILAGFGVILAIGLWWIRRRRQRRKEQMRLSGQNALARDLDGWVNTRRWMHGAWRHNQATVFIRREEGLNENGEAPPPYQAKTELTHQRNGSADVQNPTSDLAIPLRTLSRDESERQRPPEYQEFNLDRGLNSTPQDLRPDTGNSSHDLLRSQRGVENG